MDVQHRPWSDLPMELLELIMACLDFPDRTAVFAVCKRWQSVGLAVHEDQLPWLMFLERSTGMFELLDPWFNKKYTIQVPGLNSTKVLSSNHGWLLMCHGLSSLFFFHPFSKAKIDLPRFECPCKNFKAAFSSSPVSEDCVVPVFYSPTKASIVIGTWHHGCKMWTNHIHDLSMAFEIGCSCPIFYDGVFYCMDASGRNLGAFDVDKRTCTAFGDLKGMDFPLKLRLIVECSSGGLFLSAHDQERLQSFELDHSKMVSSEVKWLRNQTLFKDSLVSNLAVAIRDAKQSTIQSFISHLYRDFCGENCAICETMSCHDVVVRELGHGRLFMISSFDGIWIEPRWSRAQSQLDWHRQ